MLVAVHDYIYGDCQTLKLPKKYGDFDVVFAGELVEHLSNPGLFLENSRSWLKEGGLLIITTPSGRSLGKFVADFFGMWDEGWQHILSHNRSTIKHLLECYDFEVITLDFFTGEGVWNSNRKVILKKIARPFVELLFTLKPSFGHQMFVVSKKISKGTFKLSYNM
jgi:SAM-dependent methyltransferase